MVCRQCILLGSAWGHILSKHTMNSHTRMRLSIWSTDWDCDSYLGGAEAETPVISSQCFVEIMHSRQMLSGRNFAFAQFSQNLFFPLSHRNPRKGAAARRNSWQCGCSTATPSYTFLGSQRQNILGGFHKTCYYSCCSVYGKAATEGANSESQKKSTKWLNKLACLRSCYRTTQNCFASC